MTAREIVDLLAIKHEKDVFIPECKTGESSVGCLRLDAWAMARSWARPEATGYEIKVHRSDFLNDEKWRGYLKYCNKFYFVCPYGMIQPEELSEGVGLMWVSQGGKRLFTKRKAVHRDDPIPDSLYRYVLMARTKVVDTGTYSKPTKEFWYRWLREKEINREFGWMVSRTLAQTIQTKITDVQNENSRLMKEHLQWMSLRDRIEASGINLEEKNPWHVSNAVSRKLAELNEILPPDIDNLLYRTSEGLLRIRTFLNKEKDRL